MPQSWNTYGQIISQNLIKIITKTFWQGFLFIVSSSNTFWLQEEVCCCKAPTCLSHSSQLNLLAQLDSSQRSVRGCPNRAKGKGTSTGLFNINDRRCLIHFVKIFISEHQKHGNQLLAVAVAVAGSCLPLNFIRDPNIQHWVNYIAPQVHCIRFISTVHGFHINFSINYHVTRSSAPWLACCGQKSETTWGNRSIASLLD